jgi:hypothetical protein
MIVDSQAGSAAGAVAPWVVRLPIAAVNVESVTAPDGVAVARCACA